MATKPIADMSEEELLAEIDRLHSFKVPAAPTAKAPKKPTDRDGKGGGRKAKWKEQYGF